VGCRLLAVDSLIYDSNHHVRHPRAALAHRYKALPLTTATKERKSNTKTNSRTGQVTVPSNTSAASATGARSSTRRRSLLPRFEECCRSPRMSYSAGWTLILTSKHFWIVSAMKRHAHFVCCALSSFPDLKSPHPRSRSGCVHLHPPCSRPSHSPDPLRGALWALLSVHLGPFE